MRIKDKILCCHFVQIKVSPSSCSLRRVQRTWAVLVPSPSSVPLPHEREKSQLCASNLSPGEPVFESFDSLCHHGCNFCKTGGKKEKTKINIKAEVTEQESRKRFRAAALANEGLQCPSYFQVMDRGGPTLLSAPQEHTSLVNSLFSSEKSELFFTANSWMEQRQHKGKGKQVKQTVEHSIFFKYCQDLRRAQSKLQAPHPDPAPPDFLYAFSCGRSLN